MQRGETTLGPDVVSGGQGQFAAAADEPDRVHAGEHRVAGDSVQQTGGQPDQVVLLVGNPVVLVDAAPSRGVTCSGVTDSSNSSNGRPTSSSARATCCGDDDVAISRS